MFEKIRRIHFYRRLVGSLVKKWLGDLEGQPTVTFSGKISYQQHLVAFAGKVLVVFRHYQAINQSVRTMISEIFISKTFSLTYRFFYFVNMFVALASNSLKNLYRVDWYHKSKFEAWLLMLRLKSLVSRNI